MKMWTMEKASDPATERGLKNVREVGKDGITTERSDGILSGAGLCKASGKRETEMKRG